jgi:Bacterial Ig-like domain (group 1)
MRVLKILLLISLAALFSACSGGGGSAGAVPGTVASGTTTGVVTGTTTAVASVVTFSVALEKASIANNGVDQSKLTVTALDTDNNVVSGATVKVSTDNNSIFVPPTSTVTDASGSYVGVVKSGADKSDRIINATVTVNGISKTVGLQVKGSQLAVTVVPAVAAPGSTVTLTATAKDSYGNGISGVSVGITGAVSTNITTDLNGVATVIFTVPSSVGTYNVNASGSGVKAVSSLVVTTGGGGGIPAAVIPAGVVPSFAISPTVLAPNTVGSTANQSNFRFVILDPNNIPIPNVRVRFQKNGLGLGYDGQITSGSNTVPTNASGIATAAYIAGIESSPTDGVSFKACYSAVDFTSATDCPQSVVANMTVAGGAVAISIGANNKLEAAGVGTYSQKFAVTIVDSAGRAVVGAPVAYSVDITHFGKGLYSQTPTLSISANDIGFATPDLSTTPAAYGFRVSCPNEDINRNASIDPSEDISNNGVLEPRASDVSIAPAAPGVTTTDANGVLLLTVTWLQSVATWEIFRIKVTTNVSGSQSVAASSFPTLFITGDDAPGTFAAFKIPPYGTGACNQP